MSNDNDEKRMMMFDIINWVKSKIRTRDDSNKYGDVNTATLALL